MISRQFCGHGSHFTDCIIVTLRAMKKYRKPLLVLGISCLLGVMLARAIAAPSEGNPVRSHSAQIGPQAGRLIVGFKATSDNAVIKMIKFHSRARAVEITQAQTSESEVLSLAQRTGIAIAASRQITPSMHVIFLPTILYGADVAAALEQLRADPTVEFAEVDARRYAHALPPDDPLFVPTTAASGQWYMNTPSSSPILVEGVQTVDLAATDAVSAWGITQGSSGTVIADVDNGIRFEHPDLLRAGFGGRLLPGYDFVGADINRSNSATLSTFLMANDGDGWDPDPSDPGDWLSATDLMNPVFPATDCGNPNSSPANGPVNSSWHGTRVVGVLGAIANNATGIAGMTWNPYILPVRALGKCGGFDSDIMAGIQWAAGMAVTGVPENPYPADIINLSLGGSGTCPSGYQTLITKLSGMGVLVVASAGNESGPVDVPGNCNGVLAVAGLRNVGTKVGYSSLGPEVGVSAPAGNCVNLSGACLRSIDTTTNTGLTTPGDSTYTNQSNVNLGTSFSAPIVSGIAALMRAVNGNLTPPQLIARIKSSATAFPQPVTNPVTPVCMAGSTSSVECICTTGTCGAGMVNAFSAVKAALNPIAAVKIPPGLAAGKATFDASGSVAACNVMGLLTYAWTATGGVAVQGAANTAQVAVNWNGGAGTLVLTVTDTNSDFDTATINFSASGASSSAPASAGTSAGACTAPMTVTPAAPVVTQTFSPTGVAVNVASTLTITFSNSNGFALTQSGLTQMLPADLSIASAPLPTTTCSGEALSLTNTSSAVTLAGANIPANGSCELTLSVKSTTAGMYTNTLGANALMTGPAGGNTAAASASLTVTAAATGSASSGGGGGGGGGALDWLEILFAAGVLLAGQRQALRSAHP
jgi:serine protease